MTDALLGARRFDWIAATLVFALGLIAHPGTGLTHSRPDSHHDDVGGQADGDDAELDGTLEILHEDREDGSGVYRHFLWTHDGKRLSLDGVQHPDLLTGDLVRVRGVRSGQKFKLQMNTSAGVGSGQTPQLQTTTAAALQVLQYAPLSNTLGPQKTVVVLVNFTDAQHPSVFTRDWVKRQMDASSEFFLENSYQQTSLVTDVFGPFTLPITSSGCPTSSIASYGATAATASGIDLSAYARRVYIFPGNACMFSGMATVGGNPSTAWLNGNAQVDILNHELGHNLGLYHSHSISCPSAVLGLNCTTEEYGDTTDTMGYSVGHYNAFQKQRLGWLGYGVSPPITVVQSSGTYEIDAYEFPGTTPKALKILRSTTGQAFWVELRRKVGADTRFVETGVFVHLATDGAANSSYLLDMTPETPAYSGDEPLDVGKSFTDPVSGITVQTVSVSDTSATIAVTMGGVPPSLPSTPTALAGVGPQLTWKAGTPTTQTGFVVERAAGPTATFALIATTTAPNYLDATGVAGQCYRVRATNAAGTSGASNVACVTTPPPPPPPGDVTLTITTNSPIGREMTFGGTLTGSTSLSATIDSIAIAAKYIVVDKTRKTWTVKATGLFQGPHTFTVASGTLSVSKSFTVLK